MKQYNEMTAIEFVTQTYHKPTEVHEALIGKSVNEKINFLDDIFSLKKRMPTNVSTDAIIVEILRDLAQK